MERVSRRRLLAAGSGAALASALLGGGVASAQRGAPVGEAPMRFQAVIDPRSVDAVRTATQPGAAPTGPFYLSGALYEEGDVNPDGTLRSGAQRRGTFREHGWTYTPAPAGRTPLFLATTSIDIFDKGEIVVSGTYEQSSAIVGGTGVFKEVGGEVRVDATNEAAGVYLVEFDLRPPTVGR